MNRRLISYILFALALILIALGFLTEFGLQSVVVGLAALVIGIIFLRRSA